MELTANCLILSKLKAPSEGNSKRKGGKCANSERALVLGDLFELYVGAKIERKKENWKRYVKWLKEKHLPNSPEAQKKFKRTKSFIKELTIGSFGYFMSPIDVPGLYYLLSVAKDRSKTGKSVSSYILGAIIHR